MSILQPPLSASLWSQRKACARPTLSLCLELFPLAFSLFFALRSYISEFFSSLALSLQPKIMPKPFLFYKELLLTLPTSLLPKYMNFREGWTLLWDHITHRDQASATIILLKLFLPKSPMTLHNQINIYLLSPLDAFNIVDHNFFPEILFSARMRVCVCFPWYWSLTCVPPQLPPN